MAYLFLSFQYSLSELSVHFILEAGFVVVCSLFAPITFFCFFLLLVLHAPLMGHMAQLLALGFDC